MMSVDEKAELQGMIRREVIKGLSVLLNATTQDATKDTEGVATAFPGMGNIGQRPTVFPYGFATVAPDNTISFIARVGEHPGNRYVIGHRDAKRPTLNKGETVLYNAYGQQVRTENGKIKLGDTTSSEPIVLGNQLKTHLSTLDTNTETIGNEASTIATIVNSLTTYILLIPGLTVPQIAAITLAAANLTAAATAASTAASNVSTSDANYVANGAILSDESFARKSP